jgi:asparagine synthase (glutamine-hydrolysing)
MCGIAGLIHLDGRPLSEPEDRLILERMGNAMQHRGPDDAGITVWNNLGLVFRRLSIIDIEGGAQPFHTQDGRISSITNGEIYNHRDLRTHLAKRHEFRTESDCEVLPFLYLDRGLEMFEPVNGMFATALLDRHLNRLLLARDRLGEKPARSVLPNRHTLVCTELKAHPKCSTIDWQTTRPAQNIDITAGERPGYLG